MRRCSFTCTCGFTGLNTACMPLQVQPKGSSLMQPVITPVDSTPAFAALSAADAAPDVAYFHKFFEVKAEREAAGVRSARKKKKAKGEEEEGGPLGDDDDDDDSLADSAVSEEIGTIHSFLITEFMKIECL